MRRWLIVVLTVACLGGALSIAVPAEAVINPVPDGNQHPNVGLIVGFDATGGGFLCSGTLVNMTTVLTAAHCVSDDPGFPPVVEYIVTFDPAQTQLPDGSYLIEHYVEGTPDPNPAYVPEGVKGGAAGFLANSENDIGLLHLDHPANTVFPDIQPATIAGLSALDPYRTGPKKQLFLQVGYGTQRAHGAPPGRPDTLFFDSTRNQSLWPMKKLSDALFFGNANPNNAIGYGSPCQGDSGSPVFLNNAIVGVFTFINGPCTNTAGGIRVDAGPGRDFLRSRGLVP